MEFIENHFYKLTKEIPVKQLFQTPSWYNGAAYYSYYGNSNVYGSYTISTYDSNGNMIISNVSPYEPNRRFTVGRIYQAVSKTSLYDDMTFQYSLDENESDCFEEVEIGLNVISKRFMEKHINSGKMSFQFNFLNEDMVVLKISLNGRYSTWVSLMGGIREINEMLHNGYAALRKSYIEKFRINLEINCRWAKLMPWGENYLYDLETRGANQAVFGGRL